PIAQTTHLIRKTNFQRMKSVAREFQHFGLFETHGFQWCGDFFVQGRRHVSRTAVELANNRIWRRKEVRHRRSLSHEFRIHCQAKIFATQSVRVLLEQRKQYLTSGSWKNGTPQYHNVISLGLFQALANFSSDISNVR